MLNVGLSPSLKDNNGKTIIFGADAFNSTSILKGGPSFQGAQSSLKLLGQRTGSKHELPIIMSPQGEFDTLRRNRNSVSMAAKTVADEVSIDQQRKLLKQLKEDKLLRQKREEERRQKALDKYLEAETERSKAQQELTEKLQQERLERHKANLEKIQKQGEERNAKIAEDKKAIRQVLDSKPLHLVMQER